MHVAKLFRRQYYSSFVDCSTFGWLWKQAHMPSCVCKNNIFTFQMAVGGETSFLISKKFQMPRCRSVPMRKTSFFSISDEKKTRGRNVGRNYFFRTTDAENRQRQELIYHPYFQLFLISMISCHPILVTNFLVRIVWAASDLPRSFLSKRCGIRFGVYIV